MKYWCVFLFFPFLQLFCLDLVPNAPVQVSSSGSVSIRVSVAGNSQGFMNVWVYNQDIYYSVTTDNGATWSSEQILPVTHASSDSVCVAANESGFVIIWIDVPPGAASGLVVVTYTSDMGTTWSNETVLLNSSSGYPPPSVSATDSGFLASWWDGNGQKIQTSFSYDGINWSNAVDVNPGDLSPNVNPNSVGFGDSFLVSYEGLDGSFQPKGVSVFSSDRGASWGVNSEISGDIDVGYILYPGYYNDVFVVTWNDSNQPGGFAYCSTSTDQGSSWSTSVAITGSVTSSNYTGVPILGTSKGFFVGVHFDDNSGGVAYSTDNGQTWSSFTNVTAEFGISDAYVYNSTLSMANNDSGIMTAWVDTNFNVYSAFIPIQFLSPVVSPQNLTGKGRTNIFPGQKQVYNVLQWKPSSTQGVLGYKIYRDGELLVTVTSLSYQDFTVKSKKTYEYVVIAYTEDSESDPVMIMVKTP